METPNPYEGLPEAALRTVLTDLQDTLSRIETMGLELKLEKTIALEHLENIQRTLGCFVLSDKRRTESPEDVA